ncbi:MAG: dethiobiotin synthase [Planctomycetaceae bacterium]
MNGLFVTGTSTGVGKTYVTCAIARELRRRGTSVGAYKPVCSGSERSPGGEFWPDVARLADALDRRFEDAWISPQRFSAALAPPAAARREGRSVDRELLRSGIARWRNAVDVLLVEGVGGWLSPIAEGATVADFAREIGFPVLIVVGLELGAVNHTLLTAESVARCGLPIAGIIANRHRPDVDGVVAEETLAGIAAQTSIPLLGSVAFADEGELRPAGPFRKIDWLQLAGPVGPCVEGGDGV